LRAGAARTRLLVRAGAARTRLLVPAAGRSLLVLAGQVPPTRRRRRPVSRRRS